MNPWFLSHCTLALCLSLLAAVPINVAVANEPALERAQLALLLRQLNALERQSEYSAALTSQPSARYYFDYKRLHQDLQRIRSGIEGYLTPERAQPRDPVQLLGNYRDETSS